MTELTLVKPRVSLLLDNTCQSLEHALLLISVGSHMHLTLNGDVRIRDSRGKELAESAQEEGDARCDLALLLNGILHLLEESVLKNGVDDEHQSRDDTPEESLRALALEERHQGADGAGVLLDQNTRLILLLRLAGSHPSVDDPDRVRDDDCGGPSKRTSNHRLNGRELLVGAAGLCGSILKEGSGPFVPIVVYEVGDADAEERRVNAGVETRDAFARNDLLHGFAELALGLLGLDLCASRQRNKGIAISVLVRVAMNNTGDF